MNPDTLDIQSCREHQVIPDTVRKQLRLSKLGQIGYVVTDIDRTITYCKDAFGMSPWILLDERPDPCIQQGELIHPLLRIALAYAGPIQIELVQVMEGDTFHLRHTRELEGKIHHLGFMVQDVDKRLYDCEQMGIGVLQRGTIKDAGFTVDYAYLDTIGHAGVILELIQWRLGPLPFPTNRMVFNLVCLAGSWTVLKGRVIR